MKKIRSARRKLGPRLAASLIARRRRLRQRIAIAFALSFSLGLLVAELA